MGMGRRHIVVLGAGFGGLRFCKRLGRDPRFRITLVDRQNHHLFQPLLYQVATAGLSDSDIAQPVRDILAEYPSVEVRLGEVVAIDLAGRTVDTGAGGNIHYDELVIALGVRTSFFGNDGWAGHVHQMKSLADARRIRAGVLGALELAETSADPLERSRLMRLVVVGGGPTGVEIAGAFSDLTRHLMRRNFRHIDPADFESYLVEAAPRLLLAFDEALGRYAAERLEAMGVQVLLGDAVEEVLEGKVVVSGRVIEAANVIWAAGMEVPDVIRKLGLEGDRAGRIKVDTDLSVPGHPEVFAIGDVAQVVDVAGVAVPGVSPAAIQMGDCVAKLLRDEAGLRARGREDLIPKVRRRFRYRDKGSMATIGRSAAVAEVFGGKFRGLPAWLLWLFIHLVFLVGLRNKLSVLLGWFWGYVRAKGAARVFTNEGKIR